MGFWIPEGKTIDDFVDFGELPAVTEKAFTDYYGLRDEVIELLSPDSTGLDQLKLIKALIVAVKGV